jgi:hypothetical protein
MRPIYTPVVHWLGPCSYKAQKVVQFYPGVPFYFRTARVQTSQLSDCRDMAGKTAVNLLVSMIASGCGQ